MNRQSSQQTHDTLRHARCDLSQRVMLGYFPLGKRVQTALDALELAARNETTQVFRMNAACLQVAKADKPVSRRATNDMCSSRHAV